MDIKLSKIGEINGWPVFSNIPMHPYVLGPGYTYTISTFQAYGLSITVKRKKDCEKRVIAGIIQAIDGIQKVKEIVPIGEKSIITRKIMAEIALASLKNGFSAILPHPSQLEKDT